MIKLYGFGSAFGLADPSSFVLKLDCYLRMAAIPFESINSVSNLQKAPKGKLPFIDDNGTVIADSFFIQQYLQETYQVTLDNWLTPEQRGASQLISKSLDENLYWCIVHSRWISEDTWPIIKANFFDSFPFPLKQIAPLVARRGVRASLLKQGLGKHSEAEIHQIARHTFQALSDLLGDKPYFMGDQPCSLDAAAYAHLAQCTLAELDNGLNRIAREYTNLVQFCSRVQAQYYS